MENFEPKKLLVLRILEILQDYSDADHKLTQSDIIRLLNVLFGIECERKAIARNLDFLEQANFDIVTTKNGAYLATRKYEYSELRLLIDSVLSSKYLCANQTKELIDKLITEGGNCFKTSLHHIIKLDDWQKTDRQDILLNVELLCEAIEKNVKVEFYYNKYGLDKKLHSKHDQASIVNPFQLLLKGGKYYLLCNYEEYDNIVFCRIDHITNIVLTDKPIKKVNSLQNFTSGINLGKLSNSLPYLFDEKPETIEFLIPENLVDDIIDWFGFDFEITKFNNEQIKITLKASPRAMRFWILQYGKYVKLLAPLSLVDIIKNDILEMKKLYF